MFNPKKLSRHQKENDKFSLRQYGLNQYGTDQFFFFLSQLDSNGCITQQVNPNVLQIKNMGFEMKLKVEAKIREEGTGVNSKLMWGVKP